MVEAAGCGELQQLVQEEECEEPLSHGGEATPPSTPARSHRPNKTEVHNSSISQQILWENKAQTSPIISKGSSGQGTSQGSMVSSRAANASSYTGNQSRLTYLNEKEKQRPNRPDPPRIVRQHKAVVPCKHHCFLSEVPDVRHMEQALLQLLEDFHSGNLRAFGKDCSMEQMTEIREQQERLTRLHFELGQRQEMGGEQSGLRQSNANMRHLLHRLQQLSEIDRQIISRLPVRFQGAARKWNSMQSRSFLVDDICYDKKIKKSAIELETSASKKISEEEHMIRKLINENKLSIIYDKLPSSYTGHRPYIAHEVPIEKRKIN